MPIVSLLQEPFPFKTMQYGTKSPEYNSFQRDTELAVILIQTLWSHQLAGGTAQLNKGATLGDEIIAEPLGGDHSSWENPAHPRKPQGGCLLH